MSAPSLGAVLFLSAVAAYAGTVTTFDLTGTYDPRTTPYATSGTVTIDITTGAVEAINLTYQGQPASDVLLDESAQSYGPPLDFTQIVESWEVPPDLGYSALDIALPVPTLVGYTGGNICSLDNPCTAATSDFTNIVNNPFVNGTLTPTPEPSSFILLGAGALAMIGIMRGRLFRVQRT